MKSDVDDLNSDFILILLKIYNGAKLGVAPVAHAPPLFLPRPELKYIYVPHTSAPPRTYLVRATLLLSPDWRHWRSIIMDVL